jgi:hypothetical protein
MEIGHKSLAQESCTGAHELKDSRKVFYRSLAKRRLTQSTHGINDLLIESTITLIDQLTELMKNNYLDEVDSLIKSTDVRHATPETMIALLRITHPIRYQLLDSWRNLLDDVRVELLERKFDSEMLLRGLSPITEPFDVR